MNKFAKKIIALFLVISLFISNSNVLLRTAVISIAADGTEQAENEIAINQEITKYIPYAYLDTECGIILQQSLGVIVPDNQEIQESKYTIAIPTYAEIAPTTIEINSKTAPLTQDNTKKAYYTVEENVLTITQKEKTNDEYYITYYYGEEAYQKYLESTHVTEYNEGEIVSITKDEETGETWVFIDYEWEAEPDEGENPPENMRIMDKTPIKISAQYEAITEKENITKTNELNQELDIAIGGEVSSKINVNIDEISKGIIYNKKTINFEIENELNIIKSDIITSVKIEDLGSAFISEQGTKYNAKIEYNELTISKKSFERILGINGSISILDADGQVLGTIDSNTTENEDGNYVFVYQSNIEKIKIEIKGIQNNGFFTIKQKRLVLAEQGYLKNEMLEFQKLKMSDSITTLLENNNSQKVEQNVEIVLVEPVTSANIKINNENLSTAYENTGIEFTVELKNNNEYSDLWESPFIIIELPKEVEDITINSKNILYGEGITLQSASIIEINGNKAIKIRLGGTQLDYVSRTILGGTTIVVNTNIILKELTPTSNDNEIKLYYFNEGKTSYENGTTIKLDNEYEVGYNTTLINYIAPIGFKTIHKMSGFNESGSIVNSENSEKEIGKISILEPEKEVKQNITIMNNTGNKTTNVRVIGRIPFVGNTNIITNEDLQTTINTVLTQQITYIGELEREITIYYSENGQADTNLDNEDNGWTLEVKNLEKFKIFMIVIPNLQQGEKMIFEYKIKIPAQLEHNESLYSSLVTYYMNNSEIGVIEEISEANIIGLTTGVGARAKIELSAGIDTNIEVSERQKVEYTIKVSNTGELPIKDVVIVNPIPEGASYIEETIIENDIQTYNKYTYHSSSNELVWNLGDIAENQIIELKYTLMVNKIPSILSYYGSQDGFIEENGLYYLVSQNEDGEEIKTALTDIPNITIVNKVKLQASNIEKEIYSNEVKNDVKKSYFRISESSSVDKAVYIQETQEYEYVIVIENERDALVQNVQITKKIPQGLIYKETEIVVGNGNINYIGDIVTITSETLGAYETMELIIRVVVDKLPEGEYKTEITTHTEVSADGTEVNTSSSVTNIIGKPELMTKIECDNKQRYIYEKDILNYTITVTNKNDVTATRLQLINIIPEYTNFITGSYIINEEEYTLISDGTRNVVVETNLKQQTIIIKIQVQVDTIDLAEEEIEILNKASMKSVTFDEIEIGEIKHTVINTIENNNGDDNNSSSGSDDTDDNGNSGNNSEDGNGSSGNNKGETGEEGITRYKIKGSVWNDKNRDGERQDNEDIINGIKVYLINEKGEIIKDYKTGAEKIVITDMDGEYEFKNIEKGKYMVIFIYDNETYDITEYQKNGIVNDRNSDAILKNIIIDGSEKQAGVTDILEISDRNLYSIDLGLSLKAKFNMMLEAGISSITIKTKEGTKQQAYDMANFAKVEIKSKYINGAQVIIEYNIKITNNGEVAGSVNQIMSEKVNGLTFTSSANKDWYQGNDNNLYLTTLTNVILQPGESTNVKLVFAKTMTSSNTGTIENNFKIIKTYNDRGTEETTLEDNTAKTTCIITISTGKTIAYTGIALLSLSILAIGIYEIRRKFTEEKRWV